MDHHDVFRHAAQQHGVIAGYQLASIGLSEKARRHLLRRGALERVSRAVFRVAGSPDTLQQRRMAAVLDAGPGAALSHDAAAAAWGMGHDAHPRLQVVRARRGTAPRVSLARVHEVRDLRTHHVIAMDGVPTTTPARTVVDLAATTYPDRVARILDAAWASRLLGIGEVANIVAEVRGRGRAGVVLLDDLQDRRLRAAGYLVERFSDAEILYDEPAVLRRARAALVLACSSAPIGAELQARTEKAKAKGTENGTEKEAVKETESEDGIAKGGGVAA